MKRKPASLEARLRKKFIVAAMLAVTAVLGIMIGAINIANYVSVCKVADARLDLIVQNGGSLAISATNSPALLDEAGESDPAGTSDPALKGEPGTMKPENEGHDDRGLSAESPYDTRYFTVSYDDDGGLLDIDVENIAAIDAAEAEDLAQNVLKAPAESGFVRCYRYLVQKADDGTTMCIFVDSERELDSFKSFLAMSMGISTLGWVAVLVLVVVLSRTVVKPVSEAYAKQKRFITDASHELKTPLAIISADIEVQEIESGETEWTASMRAQVERMAGLVERLVFLARMDEGAKAIAKTEIDLSDLVRAVAAPFESVAQARRETLAYSIEDGITVQGDANALKQLVELLLDNATRYAKADSEIELLLKRVEKHAVLSVGNLVDELPPGDLNKLFERFYRADTSRSTQTGGTGVGLSVVKAIAEAHGGNASCTGLGNTIRFDITL